jgi:hypothetical protein
MPLVAPLKLPLEPAPPLVPPAVDPAPLLPVPEKLPLEDAFPDDWPLPPEALAPLPLPEPLLGSGLPLPVNP